MAFKMEELGKEVIITDSGIYTRLDKLQKNVRGVSGYLSEDTLFVVPVGEGGDSRNLYGGLFLGITEKRGRRSVDVYSIAKDGLKKIPSEKIEFANTGNRGSDDRIQLPAIFYRSGLLKEMGFTPAELNKLYTVGLIPPDADIMGLMGMGYGAKSRHVVYSTENRGTPATMRAIANQRIREQNRGNLGYDRNRVFYDPDAGTFVPGRSIGTEDDADASGTPDKTEDNAPSLVNSIESDRIIDTEETMYREVIEWTGDPQIVPNELKK